jgi:hypothetical protein
MDVWNECDSISRKTAIEDERVGTLDRFETQLSAYIANRFVFSVIGTRDQSEALELEKACIATVAQCPLCKEITTTELQPKKGFLWNAMHTGPRSPRLNDQQLSLLRARAGIGAR